MKDCRLCLPLGYEATLAKPTTQFCPLLSLSHLLTSNESRCHFGDPKNTVTPSARLTQVIFTHFLVFQLYFVLISDCCWGTLMLRHCSHPKFFQCPALILDLSHHNSSFIITIFKSDVPQPPTQPTNLLQILFRALFVFFRNRVFRFFWSERSLALSYVQFCSADPTWYDSDAKQKKVFFSSHLI